MDEKIQDRPLDHIELQLEIDATTGEGAAFIDSYEDLEIINKALFDKCHEVMRGGGSSVADNSELMTALVSGSVDSMIDAIKAVDPDERVEVAAHLYYRQMKDLSDFLHKYQSKSGIAIDPGKLEDIYEALASDYENSENEEFYDGIKGSLAHMYSEILNGLFKHAAPNEHDMRQYKKEKLKQIVLETSKDIGKIALGTTAAIIATRFMGKSQ